ncbi:protein CutA homolog [Clarias gariepinus]|uniref:protein CutA homolog n=1 Tax=Clarias gariepinus TaxID=13013 RepID=UPI00234DCD7C|nr:protein CutA homolog [Clarias gariepinus]
MDWFCPRWHTDQISHSTTRARVLVIFWTMILTMMLYPVMSMLAIQMYTALSGSYLAGHHSVLIINCPSEQTAKDIGRYIMEKRMAASVNILPRTSTMFYWKGAIQESSETLLLVRTRTSVIQRLSDFVKTIHPYETPEIFSFPMQDGSHSYLKWIDDAVPDV